MINLDQVKTLEWKVKQAVQLIVQLRRENDMLRGRLSDTEVRLQELESMVETFKVTQSQMESGIRSALDELDHLDADQAESPPSETASAEPAVTVEAETALSAESEPLLDGDAVFEEEYAALVAAEAASLVDPAPVSVELVDETPGPEAEAEEPEVSEPAAKTPAAAEDRDEQPGLGIF